MKYFYQIINLVMVILTFLGWIIFLIISPPLTLWIIIFRLFLSLLLGWTCGYAIGASIVDMHERKTIKKLEEIRNKHYPQDKDLTRF